MFEGPNSAPEVSPKEENIEHVSQKEILNRLKQTRDDLQTAEVLDEEVLVMRGGTTGELLVRCSDDGNLNQKAAGLNYMNSGSSRGIRDAGIDQQIRAIFEKTKLINQKLTPMVKMTPGGDALVGTFTTAKELLKTLEKLAQK